MALDVATWISAGLNGILTLFREPLIRNHIILSETVKVTSPDGTTTEATKSKDAMDFERELKRREGPIKNLFPTSTPRQQHFIGHQMRRLGRAPGVLWVDDHPNNNNYPHKSFTRIGVYVKQVLTTDAALTELRQHPDKYDVVITDMRRGDEPRAGYDLLERLQAADVRQPVIIYSAGSRSASNREEAIAHGALAATNTPEKLFEYVTYAIEHASTPPETGT
jgi:CheY-like chemotaxis protein